MSPNDRSLKRCTCCTWYHPCLPRPFYMLAEAMLTWPNTGGPVLKGTLSTSHFLQKLKLKLIFYTFFTVIGAKQTQVYLLHVGITLHCCFAVAGYSILTPYWTDFNRSLDPKRSKKKKRVSLKYFDNKYQLRPTTWWPQSFLTVI